MKAKLPLLYTHEYVEERIIYFDMLALLVLHEVFGFGAERLRRYYRAIDELDRHYHRYEAAGEPVFGKKDKRGMSKTVLWAMKRDLKSIGFDYDKETAD